MENFELSPRHCERCKGSGIREPMFAGDTRSKCRPCDGAGTFQAPNEAEIRAAIIATRGKNKGKLRSSYSSFKNPPRAYYVWRLARFHGGADVTMPVMADVLNGGDPFKAELDTLADTIARESFGTDLAAAFRWGRALGY